MKVRKANKDNIIELRLKELLGKEHLSRLVAGQAQSLIFCFYNPKSKI